MRVRVVPIEAPAAPPRRRNSVSALPAAASWFGPRGGAGFVVVERDPPPNRRRVVVFTASPPPPQAVWAAGKRRGAAAAVEDWDVAALARPRLRFVWPGGTSILAPDLIAAAILQLRATPAAVSLFGDAGDSTATTNKFQADLVTGANLPYLCFREPIAERSYDSMGEWIERGQVTASIFAASKAQARQLSKAAEAALNDAALPFEDALTIYFRAVTPSFPVDPDPAVGSPVAYERRIIFHYIVESSLSGTPS